tara:strand:- start:595 stop:963 length:369 start_codon:yes stop_codon:yes gene_type:complete
MDNSIGKIFIREPWATLVVSGQKALETAATALPDKYRGQVLDVQITGGLTIGKVMFKGYKRYFNDKEFDSDYRLHLVPPGSRFHYDNRIRSFAWIVDQFEAIEPALIEPMRSQYRLELYSDN